MGTRKLSFRLLLALISAVVVLAVAAACSSSMPESDPAEPKPHPGFPWAVPDFAPCGEQASDMFIWSLSQKHIDLFWRQPYLRGLIVGYMRNEDGSWTNRRGLILRYRNEPRDHKHLEVSARIPDCIEGVRVQRIGGDADIHPPWEDNRLSAKARPPRTTMPECVYDNTWERRSKIFEKYKYLFLRHPNSRYYTTAYLVDEEGEWIRDESMGVITIFLHPWVDLETIPPELRIPDCIEGIPTQIAGSRYWKGI